MWLFKEHSVSGYNYKLNIWQVTISRQLNKLQRTSLSLSIIPLHLHHPHFFSSSGLFYGLHFFNVSSHLCTKLFPLSVELLQLLLQQRWVTGCDALGQVCLHGGQFPQSTGQMLQRELWPLHNTHTHRNFTTQSNGHVQAICSRFSPSDCPD